MPKFFLLAAVLLSQADSDADNATPLTRLGGRWIERAGALQVAIGGGPFPAVQIRVAALQVGQHRLGLQCQGSAERLDRDRGLTGRQSPIALGQQTPEVPFPANVNPAQHAADHQRGSAAGQDDALTHRPDATTAGRSALAPGPGAGAYSPSWARD